MLDDSHAGIRARLVAALEHAHETHPCTCGWTTYATCVHEGRLSEAERGADAVMDAVVRPLLTRVAELEEAAAQQRAADLHEAAARLDDIADAAEVRVAEHYGTASGIGPGSADMVREAARTVRDMADRPAGATGGTITPLAAPAAVPPTALSDDEEWVRCSRSHCRRAERYAVARERGWEPVGMGQWLDPQCAADDGKPAVHRAAEAHAPSGDVAAIAAAGPLCTCVAFPAAHRVDLHNEDGRVVGIEQVPSTGSDLLLRARCTRCGWVSGQSWFAEDFGRASAQTCIADHRDRWSGHCL